MADSSTATKTNKKSASKGKTTDKADLPKGKADASAGNGRVSGDALYALNPQVRIIQVNEDEFLVRHGNRSSFSLLLADEERSGVLGALIGERDGVFRQPRSLDIGDIGLAADRQESAQKMLDLLLDRGVVASSGVSSMAALARLSPNGDGETLATKSVSLISDSPSLLDPIREDLEGLGLGSFSCIDRSKNGPGRIAMTDDEIAEAVDGQDLAVLPWSTFSPSLFHNVNKVCLELGVPWLPGYVDGSEVVIGPSVIPGNTACYHEYEVQIEASNVQKDAYYIYREHQDNSNQGGLEVAGPYARVLTGFMTPIVLAFLTGGDLPTIERVIRIDFEQFAIDYQKFLRLPRCPACATVVAPYRATYL